MNRVNADINPSSNTRDNISVPHLHVHSLLEVGVLVLQSYRKMLDTGPTGGGVGRKRGLERCLKMRQALLSDHTEALSGVFT